jgi:nucleotide-binding universal stress UspA family protein
MFQHILVPLDGSSLAECALDHSLALARAFDARVTFLQVLEEQLVGCSRPVDPLEWNMCKAEVHSYLEAIIERFEAAGVQADYALLEGHPGPRILEFMQSRKIDLMIVSSHGRSGLNGWNAGGVINKVVLRSSVSTLLLRAYLPAKRGDEVGFQRLLVPLDCSQRAECSLEPAAAIARLHNSHILVVHMIRKPEMPCKTPPTAEDIELADRIIERNQREAKKYFERLQPRLPSGAQIRLVLADSVPLRLHELIVEENIDLLILSAHGYSGMTRWPYGSTASSFLLYGSVPVLVVQDLLPEQFEFYPAEFGVQQKKGH